MKTELQAQIDRIPLDEELRKTALSGAGKISEDEATQDAASLKQALDKNPGTVQRLRRVMRRTNPK